MLPIKIGYLDLQEIFYVIPCMWNWQLSHDAWWEHLPKDDIMPGQHIRTCMHPPKIMHGKSGQKFADGFYSHRWVQSVSRCRPAPL